MSIVKFTAFYPSRPYFADRKPTSIPKSTTDFFKKMDKVVFSNDNDSFLLRVCRDGRIIVRIKSLEKDIEGKNTRSIEQNVKHWSQYLEYLNSIYLLIDSAMLELDNNAYFNIHEITRRDAFRVSYKNGEWNGEQMADESLASRFQRTRLFKESIYGGAWALEMDFDQRQTVPIKIFDHACQNFYKCSKQAIIIKYLSRLTKSISEYKVGSYENSIIFSWFIIESIMNDFWDKVLAEKDRQISPTEKRINKDRKKFLTGREFPSSVVSNLLELEGEIDYEEFKEINNVRGHRNDIVHSIGKKPITVKEARAALNIARKMIEKRSGIDLHINDGYHVFGL
ncbi:hypothetical protein [Rhodobium gokarnense]|uniref:RiboL-PSP-HEPN domain-containing protein n=1 Tax=Rhodobium gokarnense TaxID=364296 RepID=A0ABT3H8T0_9HYPH|nr:hypothetical protein [Rhodobium gokarnense]MCW2306812.1 hypothetical protein [Rhodobium gokarnense]